MGPAPSHQPGTIAKLYSDQSADRQPFIDRGRDNAKLTIPGLFPEAGKKSNRLPQPYQGIGSRGVNNLAAKLLLALFPSNLPFFRLAIDDFALAELAKAEGARGEAEKGLNKIERAVAMDVETTAIRVPLFEALKHLIVVGNILFYRDPATGKARAIPLTSYVCTRDPLGNCLELIVEEMIALVLLPEEVQDQIKAQAKASQTDQKPQEIVRLYTRIERKTRKWEVTQEACGVAITSAAGAYPLDQCPWLPLRMVLMDGENYGRSFVEEHYADLASLEKLTKAIIQFAAASAKIVFGVRPNASVKIKDLAKAASGDFVNGDLEKDVTVLQLQKQGDFQVAKAVADGIKESLSYVFMLNSAIQRNGERVTAEEIRRLSQELDSSLGGVHALLAQELQLPLVTIIMAAKVKRNELPKLPKGFVKPVIVTGIQALGRGSDLDNLMSAIQALSTVPSALARIKGGEVGKRVFAAVNIDSDGLFMTDQEVQQQQAQEAMAKMAQSAAPQLASTATQGPPP